MAGVRPCRRFLDPGILGGQRRRGRRGRRQLPDHDRLRRGDRQGGTDAEPADREATETPKKPPIANTETREPEPPQTPTIGTRKVPESGHATAETPKKPPIANTETREPEPPQTPTIGTREVPEPGHATTETPKKPPIDGWKPQRLDSGEWGAVLEGELVAELPDSDQLPGTAISVTDSKGDSWTTTIVAVVNRSDADIVVTNAGRPRD